MKKTLDTRTSKGREGEKIFLHSVVKGATGGNMKTKTGASKVNVSMPKDLFDYVKRCVEEHNAKPENIYRPTDFSKMVQKAVHEMMQHDRSLKVGDTKQGKAATPERAGAKMEKLSENLDCGPSTATKKPFRRAG